MQQDLITLLLGVVLFSNIHFAEAQDPKFGFPEDVSDFIVREGELALFECAIINLGNNSVSWYIANSDRTISVNDEVLVSDERYKVGLAKISDNESLYFLKIYSIKKEESGVYVCQINTGSSQTTNLKVQVGGPKILGSDEIISAPLRGQVSLTCEVDSLEPDSISWTRFTPLTMSEDPLTFGDQVFISDYRFSVSEAANGSVTKSTLTIASLKMDDDGYYFCTLVRNSNERQSNRLEIVSGSYNPSPKLTTAAPDRSLPKLDFPNHMRLRRTAAKRQPVDLVRGNLIHSALQDNNRNYIKLDPYNILFIKDNVKDWSSFSNPIGIEFDLLRIGPGNQPNCSKPFGFYDKAASVQKVIGYSIGLTDLTFCGRFLTRPNFRCFQYEPLSGLRRAIDTPSDIHGPGTNALTFHSIHGDLWIGGGSDPVRPGENFWSVLQLSEISEWKPVNQEPVFKYPEVSESEKSYVNKLKEVESMNQPISKDELPPPDPDLPMRLPRPLSHGCIVQINDEDFFIAGGDTDPGANQFLYHFMYNSNSNSWSKISYPQDAYKATECGLARDSQGNVEIHLSRYPIKTGPYSSKRAQIDVFNLRTGDWKVGAMEIPIAGWTPKILQLENNYLIYGDYFEKKKNDYLMEYVPDLSRYFLRKEKIPQPWSSLKAIVAPEHWCY